MATTTSYSYAREHLASLWDEVEDSREAAVIHRRGRENMALIPAEELSILRETAYLLRSPENAVCLLAALTRARRGRRINEADRLVHEVFDDRIEFLQARYHYG